MGGGKIKDATALPSDVAKGKVFYNNDGRQIGANNLLFKTETITLGGGESAYGQNELIVSYRLFPAKKVYPYIEFATAFQGTQYLYGGCELKGNLIGFIYKNTTYYFSLDMSGGARLTFRENDTFQNGNGRDYAFCFWNNKVYTGNEGMGNQLTLVYRN